MSSPVRLSHLFLWEASEQSAFKDSRLGLGSPANGRAL
jgi:hypothetical protein